MCLGFPRNILARLLIGFDFEGYAVKRFTTDKCFTSKGLEALSFRTLFCNLMLFQ